MGSIEGRNVDVRERIVRAAADLLARGGREAVSTRAVSAAAGVQAPTIYRHFGDMRGLLDAAARETMARYVREKAARKPSADPVADLRLGWDLHIAFGLANPAAFALLHPDPPALRDGEEVLHRLVARIAEAGRLRVTVPHAVRLIAAAGAGVTLTLTAVPPEARDPKLSTAMRDALIAAITTPPEAESGPADAPGAGRMAARAVSLHAVLAEATDRLTAAEQRLLGEWLDRLAESG